ncbi:Mfs monocarboxylate [Lasiodiplodia theobromae]|uniref:Mfs monocarboxylate n=1 Tax=Lasiodiplodia theobromae TaxID=45133 RepID=UPI0015C3565C|nr:Mfs monocarboxylate [Lasiodiplodia theobromae]KAF4542177.1 Mfs monocarboxylate [Lasiodiplodia theobromae]
MEQEALPQTDGGKTAWLVLAACSLIQVPVWGFSIAFGIFQEYYSTAPGLVGDKSSVANIGTATTGILYLSSPLTFTLLTLYPSLRHWFGPIGLLVLSGSFLASAFARQVWQLVALQGVIAGLGAGLLFAQSTLCLDERFARRKGLAYGIMWAGKSATGVGLPFAISGGLERFGYKATMLAWTVAVTAITAPLLFILRPQCPSTAAESSPSSSSTPSGTNSTTTTTTTTTANSRSTATSTARRPSSASGRQRRRRLDALPLLRSRSFWALQTGNVLQSLGYFLPAAYLPSYATQELALPPRTGALLLALLNATSVPGGILIGALCDRVRDAKGTRRVLLVSALPSAGAVLLFWGLAGPRGGGGSSSSIDSTGKIMTSAVSSTSSEAGAISNNTLLLPATPGGSSSSSSSVALLVVFALAYGFFAGGFSSTWGGVLRELERENPTLDTGFAFGLLAGGRGVGNVVSGPISVALIASTRARNAAAVSSGDHGQMMGSRSSGGGESGVVEVVGGGLAAAAGAYGSAYGPMILYTGISALLGAWGWVCQRPSSSSSSSTLAFMDPSSWRRWCQRAALLCRLAVPAPHWRRQHQRPWNSSCVSGGAGGGSTDGGAARGVVRAVVGAWRPSTAAAPARQ